MLEVKEMVKEGAGDCKTSLKVYDRTVDLKDEF
jgi:hypothetical protein